MKESDLLGVPKERSKEKSQLWLVCLQKTGHAKWVIGH